MSSPLSVVKIGDVPIYEIKASYYFLPAINNELLASEILTTASNPEIRMSNGRNYSGSMYEDSFFTYGPETNNLLTCVEQIAKGFDCTVHHPIWTQVQHQYESCNLHDHRGDGLLYGFVYYVKVPVGAGVLYFEYGDAGTSVIHPVESMCIVFPTYLKHGVTKNLSADYRISIAGNFLKNT